MLLALVAWTLYIGDRLLDARAGMGTERSHELHERHSFHWKHRRALLACAASAAAVSAWMIATLLPASARVPDSAAGAATIAYFSGVHSRWGIRGAVRRLLARVFTKELLVGILFTLGCLLPVWARMHGASAQSILERLLLPGISFAALAWLNCYAIASWEKGEARRPRKSVRRIACAVGVAGLLGAYLAAGSEPRVAALLAMGATSAFMLASLEMLRVRLAAVTLRAAADFVLLAPALLLAASWLRA